MSRLHNRNPVLFAVLWIVVYVVSLSAADNLSAAWGVEKSVTLAVCVLLTVILTVWLRKNRLTEEYGLCRPNRPAKKLLWYLPLAAMASVNLWFGVSWQKTAAETVLYVGSMLLVGFLEEIIFRGLLFKALCRDSVKTAFVVSSLTFGIGHLVNLINGSGADLFSNLLQVVYAIAGGFLFTVLFYQTGSLWAPIAAHGMLNALSVFSPQAEETVGRDLFCALALTVISLGYAVYLLNINKGDRSC